MIHNWPFLGLTILSTFAALDRVGAAIIERDFSAPGDGLLTYDTVNHREWLDITSTSEMSLDSIRIQLEPDGEYYGFSVGTAEDVNALASSAGFDRNDPNREAQFAAANNLIDLLGETLRVDTTFNTSSPSGFGGENFPDILRWRLTEAYSRVEESSEAVTPFAINTTGPPDLRGISFGANVETFVGIGLEYPPGVDGAPYRGTWLYRNAVVPEPSAIELLAGALAFCVMPNRLRNVYNSASM